MSSILAVNASRRTDPPEGPTDRQLEDIILQALPPEYKRIRTSHLENPEVGIDDIRRMMSAIVAANFARSSSMTGIAGRGAAMPAAEDNRRDIICHYCERTGHFKNTYPEGFNDWGGRGYDDFVPGEVTKIAPSGDETT